MARSSAGAKPKRQYYDAEFKLRVVRDALRRPAGSRIKPTCRKWSGIEPVSCPGRQPPDNFRGGRAQFSALPTRPHGPPKPVPPARRAPPRANLTRPRPCALRARSS